MSSNCTNRPNISLRPHSRGQPITAYEMPDASRTASSTPLSTHRDFERLCPVPRQKPLLTVFSWLVSGLVHRNPLVSATVLCMVLICGTGVVVSWSYNRDMLDSDDVIQYASGRNGVSLPSVSLISVGFEVIRDMADRAHRTWLSSGCGQRNDVFCVGGRRMWGI